MGLTINLPIRPDQDAFNAQRWEEVMYGSPKVIALIHSYYGKRSLGESLKFQVRGEAPLDCAQPAAALV